MRRRTFLSGLAAPAIGGSFGLGFGPVLASTPTLRLSGYAYDRVQGLLSGEIDIVGFDHSFETDGIGGLNSDALGGPMNREVTEIGLVPYRCGPRNLNR